VLRDNNAGHPAGAAQAIIQADVHRAAERDGCEEPLPQFLESRGGEARPSSMQNDAAQQQSVLWTTGAFPLRGAFTDLSGSALLHDRLPQAAGKDIGGGLRQTDQMGPRGGCSPERYAGKGEE
jgi:hypothetical protein